MPANHNNTERIDKAANTRRNTEDEAARMPRSTNAARDAFQSEVEAAVQRVQRTTDQITQEFVRCGPLAEELARRTTQNTAAVSQASQVLAKGAQEISQEWFSLAQERLASNLEALIRLANCRSLQDFTEVQSDIIWDRLSLAVESSRRIAQVSARVADEAASVVQAQAQHNANEVKRNAQSVRQAA